MLQFLNLLTGTNHDWSPVSWSGDSRSAVCNSKRQSLSTARTEDHKFVSWMRLLYVANHNGRDFSLSSEIFCYQWQYLDSNMGKRRSKLEKMKLSNKKLSAGATLLNMEESECDSDVQEFVLPKRKIIKPGRSAR